MPDIRLLFVGTDTGAYVVLIFPDDATYRWEVRDPDEHRLLASHTRYPTSADAAAGALRWIAVHDQDITQIYRR